MARLQLRLTVLLVLIVGIALGSARLASAQANDPLGAPPTSAVPSSAPAPGGAAAVGASAPATVRSEGPLAKSDVGVTSAVAGAGRRGEVVETILQALDAPTECDFTETPLSEVMEYFKGKYKIEIQLDHKAMTDEAIDASVPVTRSVRNVKFKSALRLILGDLNLAYVIRDEVLLITTKTVADSLLETRTYPVQDLLSRWAAGVLRGADLINTVTATVQPTTWDENGGPGSIQILPGTLVVSQTQQVHEEIADLLALLRRTKKQQTADKAAEAARAAAGDTHPANHEMRIAVYRLPQVDGEGLKAAVLALISPKTWKENGGEGSIQFVRAANPEPPIRSQQQSDRPASSPASAAQLPHNVIVNPGGPARDSGDLFVVRQTDDVHDAIDELLDEIEPRTSSGGQGGGLGGGLFRVRP